MDRKNIFATGLFVIFLLSWWFVGYVEFVDRNKVPFGGYSDKRLVCLPDSAVSFEEGKQAFQYNIIGNWFYDLQPELEGLLVCPPRWTGKSGWLHWPCCKDSLMLETYSYILDEVEEDRVKAFMGFADGGRYLNRLVQKKSLGVPVISIGAAGVVENNQYDNELYLIVGAQDPCYKEVKKFYRQLKGGKLKVHFIEHDGGHEITKEPLLEILQAIQDS